MRTICLFAALFAVLSASYLTAYGQEKKERIVNASLKEPMLVHRVGRFSLSIPAAMKQARRSNSLRFRKIEEVVWEDGSRTETAREVVWKKRLEEVAKLEPPRGEGRALIETRTITDIGRWAKAVLYYGDKYDDETVYWDLLVDGGGSGVWIKAFGVKEATEKMLRFNIEVAKSYRVTKTDEPLREASSFYLEHGAIALPYLEQEKAYARFEGHPLDLVLRIETKAVYEVEEAGLLKRTAAAILSGFAAGVDINKVRSGKRIVAGLKGEEEILRVQSEDDEPKLDFGWEYRGKPDSGDYPEIRITMESPDGHLQEKIKVWDAILDSMRPLGRE